jgi:hypothetical protein
VEPLLGQLSRGLERVEFPQDFSVINRRSDGTCEDVSRFLPSSTGEHALLLLTFPVGALVRIRN